MASNASVSRATSLSRASSKSRSLVKKNIEMHDLNPADLLIERFTAWKAIVRQLVAYFQGIADIHNNTAREMSKLAGVIQVPFRSGNQFLGEGGLQDVFYGIRDKTRQIADQHADLGRTMDSSIVQHLQKLLLEVKAHLTNIRRDTAKLATSVAKERELSTRLIGELANDISAFRNTPMNITAKTDPYIANQAVAHQLQKQVLEENLLQKSTIIMQQNSAHFEEGIVRAIQSAWQTFDEWQSRASLSNQDIYHSLSTHLSSLAPDREWISFAARSDHLLHPDTPLRDPAYITYPCKEDPSVIPVHTGRLERKRRFTRTYQEGYFVLTPAGFLHVFNTSDPSHPSGGGLAPSFSLFLPLCTLGPPSAPNSKSNKFHIEGRKDGTGTTKSGSLRGLLGRDSSVAWSFRARSRDDMMEWWNDLRMLCARYLIASEQIERNGPVEAAVRAVGYQSGEDEDEHEEEEYEGSSVEEELDEGYHEATAEESRPPRYSYEKGYHGIEMGPHGYVVEKKPDPHFTEQGAHHRHSLRQQEKAPEGQPPRAYYEHDGAEVSDEDGIGIDRDTARSPSQAADNRYETSAHAPTAPYTRDTGYIRDNIGGQGGYAAHDPVQDPHDPTHTHRHADSPRLAAATNIRATTPSPQPGHYNSLRVTSLSPPAARQRPASLRDGSPSSTRSPRSLRQDTLSPQHVASNLHYGTSSPREGPRSPAHAHATGATAPQQASPTVSSPEYQTPPPITTAVTDEAGPAPIETQHGQVQ